MNHHCMLLDYLKNLPLFAVLTPTVLSQYEKNIYQQTQGCTTALLTALLQEGFLANALCDGPFIFS
jgi:hypothetical protein